MIIKWTTIRHVKKASNRRKKRMKKLLSLFVILFMAILLVACNRPSEDDPFKIDESTAVELSASEIIELFNDLDQNQIYNDIFKILVKGSFSSEEYGYATPNNEELDDRYSYNLVETELEAELFLDFTEMVEDAFASFQLSGDYTSYSKYDGVKNAQGNIIYENTEMTSMEGNLQAFLVEAYAYLGIDAKSTSDDSFSENGPVIIEEKEKYKNAQPLPQELYEAVLRDQRSLFLDLFDIANIDFEGAEDIDLDAILEALPAIKAYKDGNKYTLLIEFTKENLLDSMEDFILELAAAFNEEYVPEQSEIDAIIDQINSVIKEFEFKYVIVIEEGRILNMAIEIKGEVNYEEENEYIWSYIEHKEIKASFDFRIEIASVGTRPNIPTDLDEYEEIDFGTIFG